MRTTALASIGDPSRRRTGSCKPCADEPGHARVARVAGGALVLALLTASWACSDDVLNPPGGTTTTTSSGGGTGTGGTGGGGGGTPGTCDAIRVAMVDWIGAHQACGPGLDCARIDLPSETQLCDVVAAPGADSEALTALVDAWQAAGCTSDGSCGFTPGTAECDGGTCTLVVDNSCAECPLDLDPQCTVDGQNALNPCFAEHCLKTTIAHAGFCDDSGACVAAGGTCEETFFYDPWCPDGTRWDVAQPEHACPGGNLRNTCCIPWNQPCSFVAISMTLSLDPFTCAPPTGNGQPWTCLHVPEQTTCSPSATMEQPLGDTYDATITVAAELGNLVTVTGTNADTGATFTCTGKVSYDPLTAEDWSCTACDGGNCEDCTVIQTGFCSL